MEVHIIKQFVLPLLCDKVIIISTQYYKGSIKLSGIQRVKSAGKSKASGTAVR